MTVSDERPASEVRYCTEMETDALRRYFALLRGNHDKRSRPRLTTESLRAVLRRKLKQRAQKKARKQNRG